MGLAELATTLPKIEAASLLSVWAVWSEVWVNTDPPDSVARVEIKSCKHVYIIKSKALRKERPTFGILNWFL